jgi:hypothetical protein
MRRILTVCRLQVVLFFVNTQIEFQMSLRASVRALVLVVATTFVVSVLSYGQTSPTTRRDKALEGIKACFRRNEVASRECKHLNRDVEILVEVYRGGDKSVLATLFRFTYLTDFYDEALLSDPDGFLTAMTHLSEKEQQAVAAGIAGGMTFRLRDIDRFKAIRELLANVPESSPTKSVAEVSLKIVEAQNASLFVNYFPPGTFTSRAANFQVAWYSSDMYKLGEKPLWPPSVENEKTFRLTYLGAFTGPEAVTLKLFPDGSGKVKMTILHESPEQVKGEQLSTVPEDRVSDFLKHLNRAHFWEMPTESQHRGFDGAEWILEGVQDGKYHVAVRWCPNLYEHSPEDAAFAEAARFLFQLAGRKHTGSC